MNPAGIEVDRPQRRAGRGPVVEVAHELLHAAVAGVGQQVPVERAVVVPLPLLGQLAAHEQQLLARVRPHPAVEGAEVGELLPAVAGHLGEQGALAVDHLVVREGEHEVLAERVVQPEGEVVVVVAPVHRVLGEVAEGVVHPAHVPLEAEPEAAAVDRAGHARPGGGLLGDRQHTGVVGVDLDVDLAQQRHRLEVLAAAVHVGEPLAGLARVVEVEHRGHGVDAQPVEVELVEPVAGVGEQEAADPAAPEVEHVGAPVGLLAAARVGVLVERGAVEAPERPLVLGEVGRHPVGDDADAGLVQGVDEVPEVVGLAPAGGGREVAGDLVAPRAGEGMAHHRQQLHVGEAHVHGVGGQLGGQLAVGALAEGVGRVPPPRAEVHLVDRHRRGPLVPGVARRQPVLVAPGVAGAVDDRRRWPGPARCGRRAGRRARRCGRRVR